MSEVPGEIIVVDYPVEVLEDPEVLTASAQHTGAMIALVPSDEDLDRLALETGEPLEELHLTLAYLGEADLIPEETRQQIMDAASSYFTVPVNTEAFSVNVFNPHTDETDTALVLGIRGEDLIGPRNNIMSAVRGFFAMPDNHEPWIPHVTLAYTEDTSRLQEFCDRLGPITFDKLRFAFGGEVTDMYLNEEITTAAATRLDPDLLKYWLGPKGSARVGGWGNPGSFTACQREMKKEGVPSNRIDGLCANLYEAATGRNPGQKKEEHALTADGYVSDVVEGCPEGQHRMPDGSCMDDDEMPQYAAWEGILTVEGVESGDSRLFSLGSLDWAQLPQPLMYQPANTGGHSGSVLVGQITNIMRHSNQLRGVGVIDLGTDNGKEVHRLMSQKLLNGVSVDVDKVKDADVEMVFADDFNKPRMTIFHRGRVRGATLVAFPAFTEAQIFLTDDLLTASAVGEIYADPEILTAATHTITIPDLPPANWFNEPTDVDIKGALTITDEGRVYGLLAPKNTTHRAVKTKVPTKNVDYSRFMGRETLVEGGGRVVTGVITMNCGHAATQNYGSLENRIEHYDNSCSVVADVKIGESKDGSVWVAGALKHFVSPEQVSTMMSCTLSGDWQPHPDRPGVREFIAALLVPVPGFAMARTGASVAYEDGALVSSAVPVEFLETAAADMMAKKQELAIAAINANKQYMASELGRI